jgi:hypothetical protein
VALVPPARLKGKKVLSLVFILGERTMATQSTEGQFTAGFREVAKTLGVIFSPILSCQSFPQTPAAVMSGRFAAFVPEPSSPCAISPLIPCDALIVMSYASWIVMRC